MSNWKNYLAPSVCLIRLPATFSLICSQDIHQAKLFGNSYSDHYNQQPLKKKHAVALGINLAKTCAIFDQMVHIIYV